MHSTHRRAQSAFTLLELSIVMVIIGILTAGILEGQSLIRAAEIQSVMRDYERYRGLVQPFSDRYNALPGDMTNATRFWGEANPNPTTCESTSSNDKKTCDGDGNNAVEFGANNEAHRFWQHLANAGLIEGTYTGMGTATTDTWNGSTPGVNSPDNKLHAVWQIRHPQTFSGDPDYWDKEYGHFALFGRDGNGHTALLTPEEAWNIDSKIDDGKPGSGSVMSYRGGATSGWASEGKLCADSSTQSTAQYNLSYTDLACPLIFEMGF